MAHPSHHDDRHGAKQPERFDPARAAMLDDRARFEYVPLDAVLTYLAIPADGTLLDFGAGTGLYAIEIAKSRPGVRIVALDEQPAMLERLRASIARSGASNVEPVTPEALAPYVGRVDRVLALNVLHELGDSALKDVRSLLAADGAAVFIDWNAGVKRPVGPPRDHVYDIDEASRRLTDAGFAVVERGLLAYHYVLRAAPF